MIDRVNIDVYISQGQQDYEPGSREREVERETRWTRKLPFKGYV
jgi:hypothetical protein